MSTRKKETSKGIYSQIEEELVYSELTAMDPLYGLVFKVMVETGIPFKHLTQLKTSDLVEHSTLKYASRLGYEREMPMSQELQQVLKAYAFERGKEGDDIFFTGKRNNNPLHPATIAQVLNQVSDKCGISPHLTANSLHMTFVYHLIQLDGDCKRAKRCLHATTDRDVYKYLGLPMPVSGGKGGAGHSDLRLSPEYIFKLSEATDAAFFKIVKVLDKGGVGKEERRKVFNYLSVIERATAEFNRVFCL